jgi:hypothetical protein
MTVIIGSEVFSPARLRATRAGSYRIAEHMLAVALDRATGQIGLLPAPGGFRTPSFVAEAAVFFYDTRARVLAHTATPTRRTS